jgi:hypothetical protein
MVAAPTALFFLDDVINRDFAPAFGRAHPWCFAEEKLPIFFHPIFIK